MLALTIGPAYPGRNKDEATHMSKRENEDIKLREQIETFFNLHLPFTIRTVTWQGPRGYYYLGQGRVVVLELRKATEWRDTYVGITVTIMPKQGGSVDATYFSFREYLGCDLNIIPLSHLTSDYDRSIVQWTGPVGATSTEEAKTRSLVKAIEDYIAIWR